MLTVCLGSEGMLFQMSPGELQVVLEDSWFWSTHGNDIHKFLL